MSPVAAFNGLIDNTSRFIRGRHGNTTEPNKKLLETQAAVYGFLFQWN